MKKPYIFLFAILLYCCPIGYAQETPAVQPAPQQVPQPTATPSTSPQAEQPAAQPQGTPSPNRGKKLRVDYVVAKSAIEGLTRATAMFQHVTERAPDNAMGWGGLALSYAYASHTNPVTADAMRLRAEDAISKTEQIDPHNALIYQARAALLRWAIALPR